MWRPKGWDAIKIAKKVEGRLFEGVSQTDVNLIEAGADAVIEGLKAEGALMTPEQMRLLAPDRKFPYGWLVFIPEEE